jgi:hypothetical protein
LGRINAGGRKCFYVYNSKITATKFEKNKLCVTYIALDNEMAEYLDKPVTIPVTLNMSLSHLDKIKCRVG